MIIEINVITDEVIRPCKVALQQLQVTDEDVGESSIKKGGVRISIWSNHDKHLECDPTQRVSKKFLPTRQEKQMHIFKFHKRKKINKKISCIFCKKNFVATYMKEHIKRSHLNKPIIRCSLPLCVTYFYSHDQKAKHEEKYHSEKIKDDMINCIYCQKLLTRLRLLNHVRVKHSSIAIRCNLTNRCVTFFHTEAEREQHLLKVHRQPEWIKCIYCKKFFRNIAQLSTHIHMQHKSVRIRCSIRKCFSFFLSQVECDQHFEEHHRQDEDKKKFHCSDCDFESNKKVNLATHVTLHHLLKSFECIKVSNSQIIPPKET